jgi:uncharacterized protein YdaU (DUF1376 family)
MTDTRKFPPAFHRMPWYPRDFASSTRTFPLVARGAYRELLDAQWDIGGMNSGFLPADPEELRELVRATPDEWKIAWRFLERQFPRVEGQMGRQNGKLEQHRQAAVREYLKRKAGADATNAARWGNRSPSRSADRTPSRSAILQTAPGPTPSESVCDQSSESPLPPPQYSEEGL